MDGDIIEECVLIHIEEQDFILKFRDIKELREFINNLIKIEIEINE
jgi:hypothetical protein